jgi:sarcosine oxidase
VSAFDTEVVVVGAGVMGLATARALVQAGRDVVVCEQFELGHARGSSHGSSRIVRLSYPDERWVRFAQETFPLWRELEAESGRPLLELHGTLDLGDWEPNRDALAACGAPFEVLDAGQIEQRFGIRADAGESGLFQADGGIVHADEAVAAFADGLDVREHVRVETVDEDGDGVTTGGVRARVAVVTAGAWAPKLVGVDATPTVETVTYFDLGRPTPSVIDTTTGARHGYALASPGDSLKAGLHQSGRPADPDQPGVPDRELSARTAAWVERRFPGAGPPRTTETCLYTIRENDEFLLERRGRIVVGSPCSGHGFKFAPVVGQRLAALALEAL